MTEFSEAAVPSNEARMELPLLSTGLLEGLPYQGCIGLALCIETGESRGADSRQRLRGLRRDAAASRDSLKKSKSLFFVVYTKSALLPQLPDQQDADEHENGED